MQRDLNKRIRTDVNSKRVPKRFRATDFPYLAKSRGFLWKHRKGNGKTTELFRRISEGLYELL